MLYKSMQHFYGSTFLIHCIAKILQYKCIFLLVCWTALSAELNPSEFLAISFFLEDGNELHGRSVYFRPVWCENKYILNPNHCLLAQIWGFVGSDQWRTNADSVTEAMPLTQRGKKLIQDLSMLLNAHRSAVASQNISITSLTIYKKEIKRLTLTRLCEDECFFFFPNSALGSAIRVMGIIKITHTFTNPILVPNFNYVTDLTSMENVDIWRHLVTPHCVLRKNAI